MKRILYPLFVLAATLSVSCSKSVDAVVSSESEMALSPVVQKSATKGIINGTTFPTTRSMVVSADLMADTGGTGNYFSNIGFSYNSGQSVWVPANTYFWPLTGGLEMLAYSAGSASVTPTWTNATKVVLSCADCTADDILMGGLTGAKPSSKSIAFKHCLAKASLNVSASVASVVKVKSVTLNFKKGATLTITKSAGSSTVSVATSLTGSATNNTMFSGNQTVTATAAALGTNGSPILVPAQTPASMTITYSLTNNNGESGNMTVTKTLSTAMVAGSAYTYNIVFTLTGITVTATLTDWANGGSTQVAV